MAPATRGQAIPAAPSIHSFFILSSYNPYAKVNIVPVKKQTQFTR